MRSFDEIYAIAAKRKGSAEELENLIAPQEDYLSPAQLSDAQWLEQMTKRIFQAGFNWKVVEAKWPGFMEAFRGFDVHACAFMDDEWFDALTSDTRIIRNGPKIRTVPENAQFILDCAKEHGSFSKMVTNWPSDDYVDLLEKLKKSGARLGGNTGQYFLRFCGVDGFIMSKDVVGRLMAENVIDKAPTSKTAQKAVQEAFNIWQQQSGRSMRDISRTLALSID